MNTRVLMRANALTLGLIGLVLSFFPEEVARTINLQAEAIVLQLLGALYFGFAFLSWMNKNKILGGIYGRPVVMANFVHFLMGALALIKHVTKAPGSMTLVIVTGVYALFAVAFAYLAFTHPNLENSEQ